MEEKHEGSTLVPTDRSESESLPQTKEFEPINTSSNPNSPGLQTLYQPTSLHNIIRTRSQNGYGCDDDEDDDLEQATSNDPFDVKWDGENDPLNPRTWKSFRKWIVVLIVSASSICV